LRNSPGTHVVANRDDPNIVSAAVDHPAVTWVSGGSRWRHDALNCPRCGAYLSNVESSWRCTCGLARPEADGIVTDKGLRGPDGTEDEIQLALPGRVNRINAAFALAASMVLGCERRGALLRISGIEHAGGRYGRVSLAGRDV